MVVLPLPVLPAIRACLVRSLRRDCDRRIAAGEVTEPYCGTVGSLYLLVSESAPSDTEAGHRAVERDRKAEGATRVTRVTERAESSERRRWWVESLPDLWRTVQQSDIERGDVPTGEVAVVVGLGAADRV